MFSSSTPAFNNVLIAKRALPPVRACALVLVSVCVLVLVLPLLVVLLVVMVLELVCVCVHDDSARVSWMDVYTRDMHSHTHAHAHLHTHRSTHQDKRQHVPVASMGSTSSTIFNAAMSLGNLE